MLSDSLGFVKRLSDLQGYHAHRCLAQIDWFSKRFGQTPQFPKVLKFDWVCKAIERFPLVPRMHPESPFSLGFVKRLSDFRVFTQFRLIDWIYNRFGDFHVAKSLNRLTFVKRWGWPAIWWFCMVSRWRNRLIDWIYKRFGDLSCFPDGLLIAKSLNRLDLQAIWWFSVSSSQSLHRLDLQAIWWSFIISGWPNRSIDWIYNRFGDFPGSPANRLIALHLSSD